MQHLIGQTLDSKYAIERELGRGGMGTVYFATHIGTERPVAVKVIAPQFMARAEFVERFRREARAAGRLRHPNVVDVTDFGIAETSSGKVAYLVMEYLDGCTLGEILEEEKQIPLSWSLDILEQVCSAVTEAHHQGIIHRDLKPDNIWLEPNQRGGYTVKVLDFGIAKLEEQVSHTVDHSVSDTLIDPTGAYRQQLTAAERKNAAETVALPKDLTATGGDRSAAMTSVSPSPASEDGTLIQPPGIEAANDDQAGIDLESGTAIMPRQQTTTAHGLDDDGTRMLSDQREDGSDAQLTSARSELTRVGAVLGTPLYMSPEQCRGEKLDPRSDIYSLGIITYQMLGGDTPFSGNYADVMKAHKEVPVPPLQAKKVRSRVKKVVMSALSKNPEDRPQTAEAYASILRAHSEGMGDLLRRGIAIYGEHLPKFLTFTLLMALPFILMTFVKVGIQFLGLFNVINPDVANWTVAVLAFTNFFVQIFFSAIVMGAITWIVSQILARPLRPISLRAAFREVKKRWKPLVFASTVNGLLIMAGLFLCVIPGVLVTMRNMLIGPAIMMEGLSGRKAFRRSKVLVSRSYWTILGIIVAMHIIPITFAMLMSLSIMSMAYNIADIYEKAQKPDQAAAAQELPESEPDVGVQIGPEGVKVSTAPEDESAVIFDTDEEVAKKKAKEKINPFKKRASIISQGIFDIIWSPIVVLITSFISVITALIYFKTRQAGGESMQDLLIQFEEADIPQSKWQQRVRARLQQSGRVASKSGSKP